MAVVEPHRNAVAAVVGGQKIDVAVAIEVAGFNFARTVYDRHRRGRHEDAGAVVEQNRDVIADVVRDQKIEIAVAVQISRGVGNRICAYRKR